MRKKYVFAKKLYISILTSIAILGTMVATTFAWVGVLNNSQFETFNVGIKESELSDYSIEVSTTGKENSFSDSISVNQIKKQILLNWGYTELQLKDKDTIDNLFSLLNQDQCTTLPTIKNGHLQKLGEFTDVYGEPTSKYYKFDLYISVRKSYDKDNDGSTFLLDAYLDNNPMQGHVKGKVLVNPYTFPSYFNNPLSEEISDSNLIPVQGGDKITEAKVNSADSCRLAFEKYDVVDKYHPEQYTDSSEPVSALIYQQGYEYPIYNKTTGTYCFGSILEDPINLATGYYNSTEWQYTSWEYWKMSISDDMYAIRGVESSTKDLLLNSTNNHIIDSSNTNEQIGINQMMKITCYFWFEGWDADCFNAINLSPVDINISFKMTNDDEF